MTTDTTYNGHKNYETWNVNLWLDNDEYICNTLQAEWVEQVEGVDWKLADLIKDYVTDPENGLVPDLGASMAADLLGAALDNVDWDEIADNVLESHPYETEEA